MLITDISPKRWLLITVAYGVSMSLFLTAFIKFLMHDYYGASIFSISAFVMLFCISLTTEGREIARNISEHNFIINYIRNFFGSRDMRRQML